MTLDCLYTETLRKQTKVSADQDGSHLCPYLSFYFVCEFAPHLTILYGIATSRPLLPNYD